jgi:carboxymethylenebutenolidase
MLATFALLALPAPAGSCCVPSMNGFANDPAFLRTHERPLPFIFQSSEGKSVTFPAGDGSNASGYFVPGHSKVAIVMIQEFWGLNDYIKQQAVILEQKTGYSVLAPDLYDGKVTSDPAEAGKLMQGADPARLTQIVEGTVKAVTDGTLDSAAKLGTIGWCFGGGWSLQTALHGGDVVRACVMYYGMPDDDQSHLAQLHAPVLLVEANRDKWISPEVVGKFEVAMKQAGKKLTVRRYDEDHAFANPSNPHYGKADAEDAMNASLRFFHRYLG